MKETCNIQTGVVLLAEPFMMDENFRRAAILVVDHVADEGTVGFILNKPLDVSLMDMTTNVPPIDSILLQGGPVQVDTIHYLHNKGDILEGSTQVVPGIFWGGDFETLKFLITTGLITKDDIRFYLGYSGWESGQLQAELDEGSWLCAPMDANYLFNADPEILWQLIMANKGDVYSIVAEWPDEPLWN